MRQMLDQIEDYKRGNLQYNTDRVRAEPVSFPPAGVAEAPATQTGYALTEEEKRMLQNYRETQKAQMSLNNAEAIINRNPLWSLVASVIRRFVPEGYGTYTFAGILIVASIANAAGYTIPLLTIPEDMTGVTGLVGIILWFLRNAK